MDSEWKIKQQRMNILFVEDDEIDQMAFKRFMKQQNLEIDFIIADSVKQALENLDQLQFDIIVSDFNLGDGNAFDLLDKDFHIPFIIVTGSGDEEIAVKAMKRGAVDYLIKDSQQGHLKFLPMILQQVFQHSQLKKAQTEAAEKIKMLFHAVQQSSTSVVITDPEGIIEYVNPKFTEVTGFTSDEVIGKKTNILKTEFHDNEFYSKLWNTVLSGKTWTGEFLNQKKNGMQFWEMATISPVFDDYGKIIRLIAIKEDVTEQKKVKRALEFRVEMADLINQISTNFINMTTNKIDEAVDESLIKISKFINIEHSFIFMYNNLNKQYKKRYSWHYQSGRKPQLTQDHFAINDIPWLHEKLIHQEMAIVPSLFTLPQGATKEKELLNKINSKTIIILPMSYENNLLGFIGFSSIISEKYWDSDTIKLVMIVVEIVVNALQRKQTAEQLEKLYYSLKQEIDLASSVQSYLIPPWLRYDNNILFSSIYKPSISIGGDLFDILPISDTKYVVYVGDISGHGVKAALMMTAVKSIINMLIESEKENLKPYFIVERLNKILCKRLFVNDYMTISLGIVDLEKNEICYISAGHPALIEYDLKTGQTKLVGKNGSIPIGWYENYEYLEEDENVIPFAENKAYLMYTDGIFECENSKGDQLGMHGFINFLEQYSDLHCGLMIPHKFKQSLMDMNYDIASDDFTLVEFQRMPVERKGKFCKFYTVKSMLQNTGPIGKECFEKTVYYMNDNEIAMKVELVINEFLNNTIEHGLENKNDTNIAFRFEIVNDEIILTFWDAGINWKIPENKNDVIAEPGKERGMGLQIIHSLVKSFTKNRFDNINETIIILEKKNE